MKRLGLPLALAAALAAAAVLMRGSGALPETPEDAVTAMFEAAGRGDPAGYLRLFSGRLKTSLQSTHSQLGPEASAASLRSTAAGIKGIAMSRSGAAAAGRQALDVDLVFAGRNERQRFVLVEQGAGWTIAAIERAAVSKPAVDYGTPVFEQVESPKRDLGQPRQ